MIIRCQPRRSRRFGVTTVEFAVVAPVFFLFILGLIEVGRAIMVCHQLNHAARTGCRAGVLQGTSTSSIKSTTDTELSEQGVKGGTVTVAVNGSASTDASSAASNDEITVSVTVPVSAITWLPFARFLTGNLSGQYSLRRE